MKKMQISVQFNIAVEGRRSSREIFKGVKLGSSRHKDVTKYTRKHKHKKDIRLE